MRRVGITEFGSDYLLNFVRKDIEIAADLEVQKRAQTVVQRKRLTEVSVNGRFQRLADPVRPLKIAHSARSILEVRFQLKKRVAEAAVAMPLGLDHSLQNFVFVTTNKS